MLNTPKVSRTFTGHTSLLVINLSAPEQLVRTLARNVDNVTHSYMYG